MVGKDVEVRRKDLVQGVLWASATQSEETGPSPCLWDYADERKLLMWDAKNLVRCDEGLPDGRAFAERYYSGVCSRKDWG